MERTYIAIDLKSFYASVECAERHLDPLTTNLVVADTTRTEKTICLAVSPSLKAHGIPGRARLFEVVQKVKEVNQMRLASAIRQHRVQKNELGKYAFASSSFDANALEADPSLELSYIVAPPRMRMYMDYSTRIYNVYSNRLHRANADTTAAACTRLSVYGVDGADALIGIDPHEVPVRVFLDELGVVVHLGFIGSELFFTVRGDTGIGGYPAAYPLRGGYFGMDIQCGGDNRDIFSFGFIKTGAGFRVNSRRIRKGGYPQNG